MECLFCLRPCPEDQGATDEALTSSWDLPGAGGSTILRKQLQSFFILRKIIELDDSWFQGALVRSSHSQGSSNSSVEMLDSWLTICRGCSPGVRKAWEVYQQIVRLQTKFEETRIQLKKGLRDAMEVREATSGLVTHQRSEELRRHFLREKKRPTRVELPEPEAEPLTVKLEPSDFLDYDDPLGYPPSGLGLEFESSMSLQHPDNYLPEPVQFMNQVSDALFQFQGDGDNHSQTHNDQTSAIQRPIQVQGYPLKRGRGRPRTRVPLARPAPAQVQGYQLGVGVPGLVAKRGPGRPRKRVPVARPAPVQVQGYQLGVGVPGQVAKRGRGRPKTRMPDDRPRRRYIKTKDLRALSFKNPNRVIDVTAAPSYGLMNYSSPTPSLGEPSTSVSSGQHEAIGEFLRHAYFTSSEAQSESLSQPEEDPLEVKAGEALGIGFGMERDHRQNTVGVTIQNLEDSGGLVPAPAPAKSRDVRSRIPSNHYFSLNYKEQKKKRNGLCPLCKTMMKVELLKDHLRLHRERKKISSSHLDQFNCKLCTYPAISLEELDAHMEHRHKGSGGSGTSRRGGVMARETGNLGLGTGTNVKNLGPNRKWFCPWTDCHLSRKTHAALQHHVWKQHPYLTESFLLGHPRKLSFYNDLILRCSHCNLILPKPSKYLKHLRTKACRPDPIKCLECGGLFNLRASLREHMKRKHRKFPHLCNICGLDFELESELNSHTEEHHNSNSMEDGEVFKCSKCEFTSPFKPVVERHEMQGHLANLRTPKKRYSCNVCRKFYSNMRGLKRHFQEKHLQQTDKLPCPYCKKLYGKDYLQLHGANHCRARPGATSTGGMGAGSAEVAGAQVEVEIQKQLLEFVGLEKA